MAPGLVDLLFGDVTLLQYLLVAFVAFAASIVGGIAGYGPGLILPIILVPIIGAEATVPVIGISAFFGNATRLHVFRAHFDARRAALVAACAVPSCIVGAYGYTLLTGPGAAIVIGAALLVLVPLRRLLERRKFRLSTRGLAVAGFGYGFLSGGTAGSGLVLLSILLATGLGGPAVIATDAAISLVMATTKAIVFQSAGVLTPSVWAMVLLIGLSVSPGAFVARWLLHRFSARIHTALIEGAVVVGGTILVVRGLFG